MKSEMIGVLVSKEVKAAAQAEADADKRSLSQLGKLALITYLENKGRLERKSA